MRPPDVLLLASLLALAGCATPADVEAAALPGTEPRDATAPREEAGGSGRDPEGTPAGEAPSDEAQAEVSLVPIAHEGVLGTGVFACAIRDGAGQCLGVGGSGQDVFEVAAIGELRAFRVTLTWTSTSPATEHLILEVDLATDAEGGWISGFGTSPLVLEIMDPMPIEGAHIRVRLPITGAQSNGHGAFVQVGVLDQPFSLEGGIEIVAIG